MNKTFQTITSILIIVLLFLLVWVFISYYTSPVENQVKPVINATNNEVPTPIVQNPVNENTPDNEQKNEQSIPADNIPVEPTVPDIIDDTKEEGSGIISSDPNISNAEKQQVLTEIDEALSELLIVVDSVTIVDETRLGIDEEVEVQP